MSESEIRDNLLYTREHEWVLVEENSVTIGITDYAQESLSDLVYVELPEIGDTINKGDTPIIVESCKAASDVYSPVSGKVTDINTNVVDDPSIINSSPYDNGWLIKIEIDDKSELDEMMDNHAYAEYL